MHRAPKSTWRSAPRVGPTKCIFSNTVKFPDDIRYAFKRGVVAFVADAEDEVRKLAMHARGSKLYVRLAVENKEAAHPLAGSVRETWAPGLPTGPRRHKWG